MTAVADPWAQPLPAGAYDELLRRALPITRAQRRWEPADGRMPALFVSHGAPPTLDDPQWLDDLFRWAQTMPKPRAIVIVSAHWEDAPVAVSSAAAGTPLVYDFGGFHPRYHELQYATPDATDLAARVVGVLGGGRPGAVHRTGRGLDHGAYIPLMAMYPDADVPVLQVSMPSQDPAALLALGERLRELRDEGVLVIGSGFMTHSFAAMRDPRLFGHVDAFDTWAAEMAHAGDVDALMGYLDKAPGARIAHPTADHFVPLLLTMGAAHDPSTTRTVFARFVYTTPIRSYTVD
ncbi:class III extradiol ring-cleavage dioxygenase [Micrococcus sp.]|uniref:DODA-type extradiol aromatic ring-opening family dioxygenase n=1 Tax=Micrococcus sp. TaxID=1271 RepID=UPI0026DCEEF6|nr:class III extradiol ring-cleavage dioxygenase [Micrococcus sp.]MDO4238725.1 class III extradiol ring-cleavage dioxygenase [Micrococcus sp.]